MFTSSGGDLRGGWGQRVGKVGLGRLGDPCRRPRQNRGEACIESIRCALAAGESERPIVALKRGNARGANGPWRTTLTQRDLEPIGRVKTRPRTEETPVELIIRDAPLTSKLRDWRAKLSANAKQVYLCMPRMMSVLLKPDAGNLHVRFDEGRGGQRSLTFGSLIPWPPSCSTVSAF
jgi:hypothetical protein